MKIAKKLLAALVAVMLVCTLAVSAFATTPATGTAVIESDWANNGGYLTLNLYLVDYVGFESGDFKIAYDGAVFDYGYVEDGADAAQVGNTMSNSFSSECNGLVDGEIQYAAYFKTSLVSAEDFANDHKPDKTVEINSAKFHAASFILKVAEGAVIDGTVITLTDKAGTELCKITAPAAEEPTTAGEEPTTAGEEPTTAGEEPTTAGEEPTTKDVCGKKDPCCGDKDCPIHGIKSGYNCTDKKCPLHYGKAVESTTLAKCDKGDECQDKNCSVHGVKPVTPDKGYNKPTNDKHVNTGDSAVLAAAAGVVLLAGAAFVVSKKRK